MKTNRTYRPLQLGKKGAVASNHPAATQAGLDVLRDGGSAVDAAVAISFVLGVVEPYMSGLGGDALIQTFTAANGKGLVFNGAGPAPASWGNTSHESITLTGPLSASVPGGLAAVSEMHRQQGSLPWARLVQPAIAIAEEGMGVTTNFRRFTAQYKDKLARFPVTANLFLPNGDLPDVGHWVVQSELGATLRTVAAEGGESFYRGSIARSLIAELEEHGFVISTEDLAAFNAEVVAPISATYRGFEVRQTPPNSTGFTFLQELKILEQFDLTKMEWQSAELTHLMVEAKKLAFVDRERHGADPRWYDTPLQALLDPGYASFLAEEIDMEQAAHRPVRQQGKASDTTYFCVVDKDGNAVSGIQSLSNGFGSGVLLPKSGVLMNNRMNCWHTDVGHPNALVGGKRVRYTMNAPLVLKNGQVWAAFGTPGADDQVQVNLQMAIGMLDYNWDPQSLAEMPRWNSSQPGQHANWPHGGGDELTVEASVGEAVIEGLRARGHNVRVVPMLQGPCAIACIRRLDNGVLMAASDPRRDGWAATY